MPIDVLTNRYDNGRAGVNSAEVELTPSSISTSAFGKLFSRTVDGDLYAQPLIVSDLWIEGAWRNVVYLATSRNWVYAYDADDQAAHVPLWTRQLGQPVPREAINPTYANFSGEIGITGTPAIERAADGGTIFLAAKSYRPGRGDASFFYRLHALDIVTGEDRTRPVTIEAYLADRPAIRFSSFHNLNRPGLLLQDGVLYLAFGSHDDEGPYHGWILAYDAGTLRQLAVYNTAPDWGEGGIWQSGTGLAGDREGYVYAVVGNGSSPGNSPTPNVKTPEYGNALLKLELDREAGVLAVRDWYTAADVFELNSHDEDLIGGPVLFEQAGPNGETLKYILGGGKDGKFYLADRDSMGKWDPSGVSNICQAEKVCQFHIHGAPVVWVQSNQTISAFVWSEQDKIKALYLKKRAFGPRPYSKSKYELPRDELRMPGGILSLSWNGRDPETAILWATHPTRENAMNKTVAGTLRAYNGRDLRRELWTSDMDAFGADRLGGLAKFSPPVVANGKVYVGTFSRELVVYGLLPHLGPDTARNEYGIFEFRGIGDNILQEGGFAGNRYLLRLSGTGISPADSGSSLPKEGFLFANLQRNTGTGAIMITAQVSGINAPDYPGGRAGLMLRRDVQSFEGHPTESVGYVAILVTQDIEAQFVVRDHVPIAAPADTLKPVRTVGTANGLSFPARFRLTAKPADGRPGWIAVTAEVASPRTAPFRPIGPAAGVEVEFDTAEVGIAGMDINVGLFATAQRDDPVREDAAPAFAHFSNVSVA
jgi:hypothetical protein